MNGTWTDRHAPKPGELIRVRAEGDEEYGDLVFEVVNLDGEVPAEQLGDMLPWKTWWSVLVQCERRCDCEGIVTAAGECRHWFLLAADSYVKVGQR